MPREEIYARTGIQFLTLNTSSQLCAHAHEGVAPNADRLLLMPDLINFFLTGKAVYGIYQRDDDADGECKQPNMGF